MQKVTSGFVVYRSITCCPLSAWLLGNSETCSRARDVVSSNRSTRKMDFDSWYITIIFITVIIHISKFSEYGD